MQVIKIKNLEKFEVFEKDFQKYFILSKSTLSPKQSVKYVLLKAKNIITDEVVEMSFDPEQYVKSERSKKEILRFFAKKEKELVFINSLNLSQTAIKTYMHEKLVPFLVDNAPYEFFVYENKVCYVKPSNIFVEVKLSDFTQDMKNKASQTYNNALKLDYSNVKLDTRKFFL